MVNRIINNDTLLSYNEEALYYFRPLMELYPDLEFTKCNGKDKPEKRAVYIFQKNRPRTRNVDIEAWKYEDFFVFFLKKSIMTEAEKAESKRDWKKDSSGRGKIQVNMSSVRELYDYIVPKLDMIVAGASSKATHSANRDTIAQKNMLDSETAQSKGDDLVTAVREIEEMGFLRGEEREVLVKARVNQDKFREKLLKRYSKCCLCGVSDPNLLTASHIKPWSESSNEEMVDCDNGFLFCPNHDKLFDRGYISFADDGRILISEELNETERLFMNVQPDTRIELTDKNREYLSFHRENIFKR